MTECLSCRTEFEFKYTDSNDERFCNKWCEKSWCDENEPGEESEGPETVYISTPQPVYSASAGKEFGSRRKLNKFMKENGIVDTHDLKDSPINVMEKDRVMTG